MELASGFSDQFNPFPGGYSPQQNAAYNASMAAAAANQAAVSQASQAYDPFAARGGFGADTAAYSAAGAAYGRAVPGEIYGRGGAPSAYPAGEVSRGPDLPDLSQDPFAAPPNSGTDDYWGDGGVNLTPGYRSVPTAADSQRVLGYVPDQSLTWQSDAPSYSPTQQNRPEPMPAQEPFNRYNPIGEIYGHPSASGYIPATQSQIDSYGPAAQSYADQHHERYGYYPEADYFAKNYSAPASTGFSGGAGTPQPPSASDQYTAPPASWDNLTPAQSSYVQQHIDRYGTGPEAGFFEPGGGWDQNYGGGARSAETVTGGDGLTDIDYGARVTPQNQIDNRSSGFAPVSGGGEELQHGLETYTQPKVDWEKYFNDVITPSPVNSGRSRVQGYNQELTDPQVSYMKQHIDRYGYGPTADFFDPGKGWDQNYGRDAIAGAIMAQGGGDAWEQNRGGLDTPHPPIGPGSTGGQFDSRFTGNSPGGGQPVYIGQPGESQGFDPIRQLEDPNRVNNNLASDAYTYGFPGSGMVGRQQDPFTSYPYTGNTTQAQMYNRVNPADDISYNPDALAKQLEDALRASGIALDDAQSSRVPYYQYPSTLNPGDYFTSPGGG